MSATFDHLLDAAFRGLGPTELAAAPPNALRGVSAADARRLEEAFAVTTVQELATNRFVRAAATITGAATGLPAFDPGPPPGWEQQFGRAPLDAYEARPDLFRIDFGPVYYRGRLDGTARLLVVGQDPSVNEILAQRVFVGQSGQRLQGFLAKLGLVRSYVMLNTFLYSIFGQFGGDNARASREDPLLGYRNSLFDLVADSSPLQAVLTVGSAARDAVDRWAGAEELARAHILHPSVPDTTRLLDSWNEGLASLHEAVDPDEGESGGGSYGQQLRPEEIPPVPRGDLPFGLPAWHGAGDHAHRDGDRIIRWHADPV